MWHFSLLTYVINHGKVNMKTAYAINMIEAKEVKTIPRMDGTGPMGLGAGTGFGRGLCAGNPGVRKGMQFGYGFGRRMGLRRMQPKNTKDRLLARKSMLQEELKAVDEALAKM